MGIGERDPTRICEVEGPEEAKSQKEGTQVEKPQCWRGGE